MRGTAARRALGLPAWALLSLACGADPAAEAEPGGSVAFTLRDGAGPHPSGSEGSRCVDTTSPPRDVWVSGWRVEMERIHHLNVRRDTTCARIEADLDFGGFVLDSSQPQLEHVFALEGAAMHFPPSTPLLLDIHYLNLDEDIRTSSAVVELLTEEEPRHLVRGLALNGATSLSIAPGSRERLRARATPPGPLDVLSMFGHVHSHSEGLVASFRGTEVYRSEGWVEPPVRHYALGELHLDPGDEVEWECPVVNESAVTLTWKNSFHEGEMCTLFGTVLGPLWEQILP